MKKCEFWSNSETENGEFSKFNRTIFRNHLFCKFTVTENLTVKRNKWFSQRPLERSLRMKWESAVNFHLPQPSATALRGKHQTLWSRLCNHSTESIGQTSPVSHLHTNLSFPSLMHHIKHPLAYTHTHTHSTTQLHGRGGFVAGANLVSASIKFYTPCAIIIRQLMSDVKHSGLT